MSLICPICGKKYFHDRKICQTCESKSIYSGLTDKEGNANQKWNCGVFLGFDTFAFSKQKVSDRYIKISSEPKFSDFKLKKEQCWNCELEIRSRGFSILKSGVSKLRTYSNLPNTELNFVRKGTNSSILYE